ncbi:hypothetical protein [Rhodalgimonas zhirmunskyi]|uniref:Toxin-activating lysine-acyltransferase n=1 Tax=Rhodalgimonas zhirmunskyi TaxID=2964767 RepID=A0AAJ1U5N7_9RHOB|nr:hypothetical protein [Rhodoalgimonas zhirmunskyi]MDQ2094066.1 hypothetical protein [Rhodoalgimonas zhirmunskyi]
MTLVSDLESDPGTSDAPETEFQKTPPPTAERFQALRNNSPLLSAGIAMSLMMGHPSFANRSFGGISRLIAGHVNRGHYLILFRDGKPAGFVGWALSPEGPARAWLEGDGSQMGDGKTGDCVLFNIFVSDGPDMTAYARRVLREELRDKRLGFARRIYDDGRIKPIEITNSRLRQNNT